MERIVLLTVALFATGQGAVENSSQSASSGAHGLVGRWKLISAEDLRSNGEVGRYPWGRHPVGWIVIDPRGYLYLQIMSSDPPVFDPNTSPAEQMQAALLNTYISYYGPYTINEAEGSISFKVLGAGRPDYVGTDQRRFFKVAGDTLSFGPARSTTGEQLMRRLTLERVK
jgi:hypothetical protein